MLKAQGQFYNVVHDGHGSAQLFELPDGGRLLRLDDFQVLNGPDLHVYLTSQERVTPALGGADDIRNLWPHSYSATAWNAHVKDALEDRLRDMVCSGSLDLAEAQQAIAGNWIEAYKKNFHTDKPLADR